MTPSFSPETVVARRDPRTCLWETLTDRTVADYRSDFDDGRILLVQSRDRLDSRVFYLHAIPRLKPGPRSAFFTSLHSDARAQRKGRS